MKKNALKAIFGGGGRKDVARRHKQHRMVS